MNELGMKLFNGYGGRVDKKTGSVVGHVLSLLKSEPAYSREFD